MGRSLTLILILVLCSKFALAQKSYRDHAIQKGESVYMISRQYGISPSAIFELNPGSEVMIYAGRTLRIPNSDTTSTPTTTTAINGDLISNYIVKRGETKFELSRRFGVSITMLEQQNPHIINMLQVGHIINLDKSIQEKERTVNKGEHYVVKGETLWGISQKYGITLTQLQTANSSRLSEFLQIGQTLIIPDNNSKTETDSDYVVQRGDTKFGLAKRFNMSIAELEEKNPQIVNMLMAGHRLHIDDTVATTNTDTPDNEPTEASNPIEDPILTEDTALNDIPVPDVDSTSTVATGDYKDYVIEPKETLFGLSRKAGMTIDEFTTLNPSLLTSVNTGDIIKMPRNITSTTVSPNTETTNTPNNTTVTQTNKNKALYDNLISETANGLYFYTPFSSDELSEPEQRRKMISTNADFQKYVDFFQGAQIAIDSAKAIGLNFDVTLIKKNIAKSNLTIESPHNKNALIVPFLENSANFPNIISDKSFSIIDIESNISSNDSINIYKSIATDSVQKTKTLNYLAKQNANIVVVSDLDENRNKGLILETLPNSKFLKVDNAGFFKSDELTIALDKNKLNYVVFDSEKTIVLLNTTTALMSKLSDYKIELVTLETSLVPEQSEVSEMRYRILKLIYPTVTNPESEKGSTAFEQNYEAEFISKPSQYSILGFDVTLDIILRISNNSSFEDTSSIISIQPHLKFDYKKINDQRYSNTGIYLMQYNSDKGIKELN
ncbi:LysM peptidoglycan-binding domain-containing protein [Winogradskyella ludwigii]|uniref:LysM peptidoglycan-binding domain-containing protein n=1 Tax=Winogradskyella ludwigii TaxID=2686076 RepID=UPI0015C94092|nr:LysM peptidoglycan-binding domain-containing protein [Winogradskyella ludwigii]